MTDFCPRDYAIDPQQFGYPSYLVWADETAENKHHLRAAKDQHRYASAIRLKAMRQYGSVAGYAEATGQSADRLWRVLHGDTEMVLGDLSAAQRYLGLQITIGRARMEQAARP